MFAQIIQADIPFGYQQANCHNISHYISLFIESKGYKCGKIWVFAPVVYASNGGLFITFDDKKKMSPTGKIDWGYHVAPFVQVRIGNKLRKMVIDPALFPTKMIDYRTWLAKLKTRKLIYLMMDSDWYLYNSSLIPNSQIQYNSNGFSEANFQLPEWFSDKLITDFFKYEDEALQQHWIEKGLAVNETAMTFYNAEIKPILHSKQQLDLLNDYKMLVGNVFNFETIFRDNNWNYEMDNNFQFKHQDIIAKYREIYFSNLYKWQDSLSLLTKCIKAKKG